MIQDVAKRLLKPIALSLAGFGISGCAGATPESVSKGAGEAAGSLVKFVKQQGHNVAEGFREKSGAPDLSKATLKPE